MQNTCMKNSQKMLESGWKHPGKVKNTPKKVKIPEIPRSSET